MSPFEQLRNWYTLMLYITCMTTASWGSTVGDEGLFSSIAGENEVLEADSFDNNYTGIRKIEEWSQQFDMQRDKVLGIYEEELEVYKNSGVEVILDGIQQFSNDMPPTKRDFIICSATIEFIDKIRQEHYRNLSILNNDSPVKAQSWALLSNANNPLYRYLSFYTIVTSRPYEIDSNISAIDFFINNDKRYESFFITARERYEMLLPFFGETDRYVRRELLLALADVPLGENLEYLEGQLKLYEGLGDSEMVDVIQGSIKSVERLLSNPPVGWSEEQTVLNEDNGELLALSEDNVDEINTALQPPPTEPEIAIETAPKPEDTSFEWLQWIILFILAAAVIAFFARRRNSDI